MGTAMEKSVSTRIIKKHIEPEILSVAEIRTKQKGHRISVKIYVDKVNNSRKIVILFISIFAIFHF